MSPTRRTLLTAAFLLAVSGFGTASAQVGSPIGPPTLTPSRRPTTSPYLNLAPDANVNNPAFQYFRRVRPENEFRRANALQSGELRSLQQQVEAQRQLLQSPESALGPTGHRTSFMSYGGYFPGARTAGRR